MKKFGKIKEVADNQSLLLQSLTLFCRDEATRTPDPYVPNVVRYQLRYIPIAPDCSKAAAKVRTLFKKKGIRNREKWMG